MSQKNGCNGSSGELPGGDDGTGDNGENMQFSNKPLALPDETVAYQISDVFAQLEWLKPTATSEAE